MANRFEPWAEATKKTIDDAEDEGTTGIANFIVLKAIAMALLTIAFAIKEHK